MYYSGADAGSKIIFVALLKYITNFHSTFVVFDMKKNANYYS